MNEAIRLELMPLMCDIKEKLDNVETIEAEIRKVDRSGCYRGPLYT